MATDPDLIEPAPAHWSPQLGQPWRFIVPAVLLIPLLALAYSWQISPATEMILLQKRHRPASPTTAAPVTQPALPAPPAPKTPSPLPQPAPQLRVFVPGADDRLHPHHPKTLTSSTASPETAFVNDASLALEKLFAEAPKYFPKGSQVEELALERGENGGPAIAHLSLNEKFWNSDYWLSGDTATNLAIESITHTVSDAYRQCGLPGEVRVLLLRNGNGVDVLGQLDVADPIAPNPSMVASP